MRSPHLILSALAVLAVIPAAQAAPTKPAPVLPAATAAPQPQLPPPEAQLIMIRSSLVALSQANQTGNYTVLNALGSDNFRINNSPARLSELFTSFRANAIDLAPVTYVNPILAQQPAIAGGKLRLVGYFPTQPMQVNFDLQYEPAGTGWKLFGIAVNLSKVTQTAQR